MAPLLSELVFEGFFTIFLTIFVLIIKKSGELLCVKGTNSLTGSCWEKRWRAVWVNLAGSPYCSRVWHAEQSEIRLWGVICQNPSRYSQKSNIDVICGRKYCNHSFIPKLGWNLTFKFQPLKSSRVWHAEQSEIRLWGVISRNPSRYSQKSIIDVIFSGKYCDHSFIPKHGWNLTFNHRNLENWDMLNNLRSTYGGSFLKTHRDIRRNQLLTSFLVENIATTRLS